jgi:uncharacterized membrane protein YeaQ/YmgE (transglycosylase-associated protein family)
MVLTIILWIVFGALVGWLASLIVRTNFEQGLLADIVLGILGAVVGGVISQFFGGPSVTGFNIPSLIVALIGAILVVAISNMVFFRRV